MRETIGSFLHATVGHAYFGRGKVVDVVGAELVVDFGYPYGERTVCCYEVSIIE